MRKPFFSEEKKGFRISSMHLTILQILRECPLRLNKNQFPFFFFGLKASQLRFNAQQNTIAKKYSSSFEQHQLI